MGIEQTTYSVYPPLGVAGQLMTSWMDSFVVEYPALSIILPGQLVELTTDGNGVVGVQAAQATNASPLPVAGLALYRDSYQPNFLQSGQLGGASNGFQVGQLVPVLRKGRAFAMWHGTTQVALVKPNYYHESGPGTYTGVITDASTSTSVGAEVSACPNGVQIVRVVPQSGTGSGSGAGLCLIELNLPAS